MKVDDKSLLHIHTDGDVLICFLVPKLSSLEHPVKIYASDWEAAE